MSIMNAVINPCMHRLRGLCFEVMFSSSLPPFPDGFTANSLRYLKLGCKEDNGRSSDSWESPTAPEQRYSLLETLFIDGRNHYNSCRTTFWETVNFWLLRVLIIANYTPLPGESFMLSDFVLPTITSDIKSLRVHNVTLVLSPFPRLTTLAAPPPWSQIN
jgi:hypothetical protein